MSMLTYPLHITFKNIWTSHTLSQLYWYKICAFIDISSQRWSHLYLPLAVHLIYTGNIFLLWLAENQCLLFAVDVIDNKHDYIYYLIKNSGYTVYITWLIWQILAAFPLRELKDLLKPWSYWKVMLFLYFTNPERIKFTMKSCERKIKSVIVHGLKFRVL